MRTEARHRLKEDPFAEGTREMFEWFQEHRVNILGGIVVAGVIVAAYLGWSYHTQNREQQASLELSQAVRTMNATVGAPETAPGQETFPTVTTRSQAAIKKLSDVADHYGNTTSGRMAAYYLGIQKMNAGDNSGAEQQLKKVSESSNKDIAALAKMALASVYIASGREEQAVPLCQDLVAHPTGTVTKEQAQLELASAYQQKQPQEALKIYRQLAAEDPGGPLANIATERMAAVMKR